jgi:hypothetical protein
MENLDLPTTSMERILELLEDDGVRDFLAHDRDKFVENYVANDPGIYVEATQNDGFYYEEEHARELFEAAKSELEQLREESRRVLDGLERSFGVIDSFEPPPNETDVSG